MPGVYSADAQRACAASWPGNAEGLCCFIQEDPISVFRLSDGPYKYVTNKPVSFRDPSGLVKWKCKYLVGTLNEPGLGFGGGLQGFTCSSACVDGKSLFVQLAGGMGGFSAGPFSAGLSMGTVILEDPYPIADPKNLTDTFRYESIGTWAGPGAGYTRLSLGRATGVSKGLTGMGGFDVGADQYWGSVWIVLQVKTPCCGTEPSE